MSHTVDVQDQTAHMLAGADTNSELYRRLKYMYGAATQIEVVNFLDVTSADSDERKQTIKADWVRAAQLFQGIVTAETGEPDTARTRPVSEGARKYFEVVKSTPAFQATFAQYPIDIVEVEIDKLVACQRTVHLDHANSLAEKFRSESNILEFCFGHAAAGSAIRVGRTGANAFTYSSENPSLRLLGASQAPYTSNGRHPGGEPVQAITLLIGFGSPIVNLYRVGNRLILSNGFHRLYTLRSLGIEYAPAVIQTVTHPELELPPMIADLPREYVTSATRPGLMKDFFNPGLTCEIRQQRFIKAVQVAWGTNESFVPR
jgi:hypothetical protein